MVNVVIVMVNVTQFLCFTQGKWSDVKTVLVVIKADNTVSIYPLSVNGLVLGCTRNTTVMPVKVFVTFGEIPASPVYWDVGVGQLPVKESCV